MQVEPSDYLPTQNEPKKVFRLAPIERDLTSIILGTRRDVLEDIDLSDGAKVLFTYLLDFSLMPSRNRGPGVVVFSTTQLCERLGRCARAIWGWKRELTGKRYVWLSDWYMPNTWPIHTYHITALHPPDSDHEMSSPDGMWGNGVRRVKAEAGLGARGLRRTKCHLTNTPEPGASEAQLPDNEPQSRTECNPSAAQSAAVHRKLCGGEPQVMRRAAAQSAAESRTECHLTAAQNVTCEPHGIAVFKETLGKREEPDRGGESLPHPKKESQKGNKPILTAGTVAKMVQAQEEEELQRWRNQIAGDFGSKQEARLKRLLSQKETATAPNVRKFIARKIHIVRELIDGPTPAPEPVPAMPAAPKQKPLPPEAVLALAQKMKRAVQEI